MPSGHEPRSIPDRDSVASNSLAVAIWTLVSRITGVAKVIIIAAVLGPTYLGNLYQALNLIPNLVYFGFLAGSLFASVLVPPLVRYISLKDLRAVERLAGGFLGMALIVFSLVAALVMIAGGIVTTILSSGVQDPSIAQAQQRIGWYFLLLFMPQVVLYGIAATSGAVMNAQNRFALPAAAPALENIGIV
ncbi:MAG: hypothetical protein M3198_10185, partial [Actinomycetota bacterium]|nr:hypothetical protein [Actinomycetota bacterium]